MKKLFQSMLVMLCLALTLTGCAGGQTAAPKPENEEQQTGEPVQGERMSCAAMANRIHSTRI